MKKNIVLIGFMGTGKTAVGRRLARRLKRKFVDTDTEIEKLTGKTVAQIFARDGATRFRSEEALLVKKLAQKEAWLFHRRRAGFKPRKPPPAENGIIIASRPILRSFTEG